MDLAIIEPPEKLPRPTRTSPRMEDNYRKVDEVPFDFERRRMSVVVADKTKGKTQMITKGAIEEMLRISSFVEYDGAVAELTEEVKRVVLAKVDELNADGMRVLGVAQKTNPSPSARFPWRTSATWC
jgi:Mg2+-importing ATPase